MDEPRSQSTTVSEPPRRPALLSPFAHVLFWTVAVAVVTLDLWSKTWAFHRLGPDEIRAIIPGVLDFRRSLNAGAVFGSFSGYTELFILASVFAVGFVLYLFVTSESRQRVLHLALALIFAGALGNLYDRLFIEADVVRYTDASGRVRMFIGHAAVEPESDTILVGDWPDGARPRAFDRDEVEVRRHGVVRDFIKFVPEFPAWVPKVGGRDVWPWVFNVADTALVCGVTLLLLGACFGRHPRE